MNEEPSGKTYPWNLDVDYGDDNEEVLLPIPPAGCPFCGYLPILRAEEAPGASSGRRSEYGFWVSCGNDGCMCQIGYTGLSNGSQRIETGSFDTCLEAAKAWNARANNQENP
jgi:hypothetical protein